MDYVLGKWGKGVILTAAQLLPWKPSIAAPSGWKVQGHEDSNPTITPWALSTENTAMEALEKTAPAALGSLALKTLRHHATSQRKKKKKQTRLNLFLYITKVTREWLVWSQLLRVTFILKLYSFLNSRISTLPGSTWKKGLLLLLVVAHLTWLCYEKVKDHS